MTGLAREVQHGTITGYKVQACRCWRCTDAQRRYNLRRDRLIAYGQWQPFVDAQPVRDHLTELSEAGLGWRRAADLAGVSRGSMKKLLFGDPGKLPSRRIRPESATALLALRADLDTLADHALVTTVGTVRRAQALGWLGWPMAEQARRIGWTTANYHSMQQRDRVTAGTARAVRALYEELSMTFAPDGGPSTRTRRTAEKNGWAPPLAWDDDRIDDPKARPRSTRPADAA